ncbi:hypothetical protein PVAND_014633 [Polypedilum vanderplanki]|uniref:Transmembrane protein n=1 Tax=Polypedilum vanderplanki TaxID=319348 RepID=A0A9J6B9R3_POLVA|nr:hypothetical protein PVAND_014633 [Polypedilum vanderplanki]
MSKFQVISCFLFFILTLQYFFSNCQAAPLLQKRNKNIEYGNSPNIYEDYYLTGYNNVPNKLSAPSWHHHEGLLPPVYG